MRHGLSVPRRDDHVAKRTAVHWPCRNLPRHDERQTKAGVALGIYCGDDVRSFLVCRGYRVLARRLRSPVGEIDLLARERAVLVIVEVKYRTTKARWPLEDRQARRLQRVALWLAATREISGGIRIDLVEVTPRCFPFLPALDHLEAAVESDFP